MLNRLMAGLAGRVLCSAVALVAYLGAAGCDPSDTVSAGPCDEQTPRVPPPPPDPCARDRTHGCPCSAGGDCAAGVQCWDGKICVAPEASHCEEACAVPPPPVPGAPSATGTAERVLAIRRFFLGATDRDGNPSERAWRELGLDLDDLVSSRHAPNHCMPYPGADPAAVKSDGYAGRDNSFGANIIGMVDSLLGDTQVAVEAEIERGGHTYLLRLRPYTGIDDAVGLGAAWYAGAGAVDPTFTGSDVWPVLSNAVQDGDVERPVLTFTSAWTSGGTIVAAQPSGRLDLVLHGTPRAPLVLPIEHAVITVEPVTGQTVSGTIAGVLDVTRFVAGAGRIGGEFDVCPGSGTFQAIANQIRAAQDIVADRSNGDRWIECDAISIGIGFEAVDAVLGSVVPAPPEPPHPCAP